MNNLYDIILNDKTVVKGKISISRARVGEDIVISGQLVTHKYIEEISQIETERYLLKGTDVTQELFGSTDFNIIYVFNAKSLVVKCGESNLTQPTIEEIEEKLYKDSDTYGGVKNE